MMSRWQSVFVLSCFCLGAVQAIPAPAADPAPAKPAAPAGDGYELSIFVEKVGDAYQAEFSAVYDLDTQAWEGPEFQGKFIKKSSAEIKGTMTVLALSKNQHASKVKIKIDSLKVASDGEPMWTAPAGDELVVERQNQPDVNGFEYLVSLNGQPLSLERSALLGMAINLLRPDDASSFERAYALAGKKKPGETWKMDSAIQEEELAKAGVPKRPGQSTLGIVSFVKVVKDAGVDCAVLKIQSSGKNFFRDTPGVKVFSKDVKIEYLFQFPLDKSNRCLVGENIYTIKTVYDQQVNSEGIERVLRVHSTTTIKETSRVVLLAPGR